ncbi:MAG: hypothetical protein FWF31_02660, partial [Desulfobulbus sp.]|nr:hypothetical protein [Desulfobulbus sp.]
FAAKIVRHPPEPAAGWGNMDIEPPAIGLLLHLPGGFQPSQERIRQLSHGPLQKSWYRKSFLAFSLWYSAKSTLSQSVPDSWSRFLKNTKRQRKHQDFFGMSKGFMRLHETSDC